jgi:prephenate dehydrogenase
MGTQLSSNKERPVVAVYGLGRFGYYWADLLSREADVLGASRTPGRAVPEGVTSATLRDLRSVQAVFLCVAISAMEETVARIHPYLSPGAVVIDTCSVKVHPASAMERVLPETFQIIASHPMFGPDSGKDGVHDLPMVVWPVRAEDSVYRYWKNFFGTRFGLRMIEMPPEKHDQEAAVTQGVTHFIGRVLREMGLRESGIGTLGYRKILQVVEQTCNDPYQLFLDLQKYNPYTPEMRKRLETAFIQVRNSLDATDETT